MNGNGSAPSTGVLNKINSFIGDLNKLAVEWYERIRGGPKPETAAGVPSAPIGQAAPQRINFTAILLGAVISVALTLVVTRFIAKDET